MRKWKQRIAYILTLLLVLTGVCGGTVFTVPGLRAVKAGNSVTATVQSLTANPTTVQKGQTVVISAKVAVSPTAVVTWKPTVSEGLTVNSTTQQAAVEELKFTVNVPADCTLSKGRFTLTKPDNVSEMNGPSDVDFAIEDEQTPQNSDTTTASTTTGTPQNGDTTTASITTGTQSPVTPVVSSNANASKISDEETIKVTPMEQTAEDEKRNTDSYDESLGLTETGTKKVDTVELDSATSSRPDGVKSKEEMGIARIAFSSITSSVLEEEGDELKNVLQKRLKSIRADANQPVKTTFFNVTPLDNQYKIMSELPGFLHFKFAYTPAESLNPGMRFQFVLYSYHNEEPLSYSELSGAPSSVSAPCFYYDGSYIHVYSNKFCAFGLGYTQVKAAAASSGTTSSTTTSYSGYSSSSGGGGGSSSGKAMYTVGKGTAKAVFSKSGKTGACYEMCDSGLKAKSAVVPATVKIGKKVYKVTKIADSAFVGYASLKTVTVNTNNLTMKGVKGALKHSKVTTIKASKKKVKAYKKIFTKKNAGKSVSVKVK